MLVNALIHRKRGKGEWRMSDHDFAQALAPSAPRRKLAVVIAAYASVYDLAKAPPAAIEAT